MNPSRNDPCPCGSGLKYKKCCGNLSGEPVVIPHPIPFAGILPIENCGEQNNAAPFEKNIFDLLCKGNLPQADILLRDYLARDPANAKVLNFFGWVAVAVNLPQFSVHYFSEAVKYAPNWQLPKANLELISKHLSEVQARLVDNAIPNEKFLLIKAWGHGFWSDVSHVLGQCLVAEITGRTPVVHWGLNSLFGDGTDANAFEFYFEKLAGCSVDDLQKEDFDFWPPKWNRENLTEGEINKWDGKFSRVAGLYLLSRPERVVVSDFYTGVVDLKPWIPKEHHLYGLSVDELFVYLMRRYLHPKLVIAEKVEVFYQQNLVSADFIAVHARGSDKVIEMNEFINELDEVNRQYKAKIDEYLVTYNCQKIFLMTDDERIFQYFTHLYGDKIIATDCRRTNNEQGIHYQAVTDRVQLGMEVMVDAYVAIRAKAFIGNGMSNPSVMVRYLMGKPASDVYLFSQNMHHIPNTFLHNW
jgi:protein O-GlcNAc transferase